MKHYLTYGLAALLAFSMAACSDDNASSNTDDPKQEEPTDDPIEEPTDDPIEEPTDDPIEEPADGWAYMLVPSIATDVEIPNGSSSRLSVMLVELKGDHAGEGKVGETIRWGVETGKESVAVSSKSSSTKEGGIATTLAVASEVFGDAVIVASSSKAPKNVRFNVKVLDKPTGSISASAEYTGPAPAMNYSIRLYDGSEVQCARINLKEGSIVNVKTDTQASPLLPAVDSNSAVFEKLLTDMDYALIAYAYSEGGAPVAAGCLDSGLIVRGNETTHGVIQLETIDLDPVTTYHIRSYFDLGDVVSALGSVGALITRITDFAANPGATLYDLLWDLIKQGVGGSAGIVEKLVSLLNLDKKLIEWFNASITENKTVCTVGLFACQFRDLVRMMEFMGELSVEKVGNVELRGTDKYDGIAAYWRVNCKNDDPNCGRLPLTTKQLGLNDTLYFLEGSWSGSVANGYDKLAIEAHELSLHYGKIVIYLITQVLVPKVTGNKVICSSNVSQAKECFTKLIAYWVNCDSIGQKLFDTLNIGWLHALGVNVSKSQAVGWCNSAASGASSILGFLTAMGELQKAGSDITISGTAMFKDTNADNVVDIIHDGGWSGSMTVTTTTTGDDGSESKVSQTTGVKGIWSAYNLRNVPDGDNSMYCTHPKTATDSDDQLCSYPAIDRNKLSPAGLCAKYSECAKDKAQD